MQRWHKDYPRTIRRWKEHRKIRVSFHEDSCGKAHRPNVSAYFLDHPFDFENEFGRFRKRSILVAECNIAHCHLCKSHKYPKRKRTFQERISALAMKEQMDELV